MAFNREDITLQLKLLAQSVALDEKLLGCNIDVDSYMSAVSREVVANFKLAIFGSTLKTETVEYPKTWWDAFKQRWYPVWLLDKYPADIVKVTFSAEELYPYLKFSLPEGQPVLRISKMTSNYTKGATN